MLTRSDNTAVQTMFVYTELHRFRAGYTGSGQQITTSNTVSSERLH